MPAEVRKALAAADLLRITVGEQWGGMGLGDVEASIVLGGDRPGRRVVGHLLPADVQRAAAGDRAPGPRGHEGALAPGGGRRRGAHQHRHHRARRRLGRPEHAGGAGRGRARALAPQRLQELLDAGRRGPGRAGLVPLAGRGGRQGHRRRDRADRPRGRVGHRAPQGHGDPRRHRGRARLRRGRDHRRRRAARRGPVEHRGLQGAAVAPQPRALRQRLHVRRRGPGRAGARGALHERARHRRAAAGRPAGPAVEAGRHGGAARRGPAAAGPGGAAGRAGRDAAGARDGAWPRRPPTWPPSSCATRPCRSTAATATRASTRSSGPTATSGACASGRGRWRRSATTSACGWPPGRVTGSPGWRDPLAGS